MPTVTYPIHELFYTFQGEGAFLGAAAFFIRTYGCPVGCTFCDAAGTWHPEWVPKDIRRYTPEELALAVTNEGADMVVITGGEPTVFDLEPLTQALYDRHVILETSGSFPIRGVFDWVVVSPKRAKAPLSESGNRADEFKFIIEKPEDIQELCDLLVTNKIHIGDKDVWLHPEWSQRENKAVLRAIVDAVKWGKHSFRAGWQLHKLYAADAQDMRSRPLVPLGGDLSKGY